jgi:predicted secreted protein
VAPVAPDVANETSNDPVALTVSDADQKMIDSFLNEQPTDNQTDVHVNAPDSIKHNTTSDVPFNIDSSQTLEQSTDTEFTALLENTLLN